MMTHWTIYATPLDYPDGYVVREWWIGPDSVTPSPVRIGVPTLAEARRYVPPGLHRMPRQRNDDVAIVETWI